MKRSTCRTGSRWLSGLLLALLPFAASAIGGVAVGAKDPDAAGPVSYQMTTVNGVPLKLVTVDMNSRSVKVTGMLAMGGPGKLESWSSMIDRARPTIAVTGTYFDTKKLLPIGDLVIGGKLAHFGGKGTAFCVSPDNVASFQIAPLYRTVDWSEYDYVMRSGPRLVWEGAIAGDPRGQGFKDPAVLGRTGRLAVGVTPTNKLLLAATRNPLSLKQMGGVMKSLGARDAINLDAGSSMGMYVRGKTIIQPRRSLTNLLLVYEDPSRYLAMLPVLVPPIAN